MSAKTEKTEGRKLGQVFGSNGVFYTFPQGEAGPMQIKIDFGQIPEPSQYYYYADSLFLTTEDPLRMAHLSFGRREGNTDKFADRIEIVMPRKSLFSQFWLSAREVESTVDKILQSTAAAWSMRPISAPGAPAVTLFANMIFVAVGEGESILDFYHLSQRQVHFAKTEKRDMQVQPTVRVIMSTVLTKYLFNALRPYAERENNPQPSAEGSRRAAK